MPERLFSFRWDVDHHACITRGIPRIAKVCREFDVANTFFVNMGRSTNLRAWFGRGFQRTKAKLTDAESIHLIKKSGWPRFAFEVVRGRPVGLSYAERLKSLRDEGHELGLHGGMDHVVWSRRFEMLSESELVADVEESLSHFVTEFGQPAGFTSPGFRSDRRVLSLLERLGFLYAGDQIGGSLQRNSVNGRTLDLWTVPVSLAGPRTIPFLEWHGARGTPEPEVLRELREHLQSRSIVVLYGHPCYEGVRDDLLRKVFALVRDEGFHFVTHEELVRRASARELVPERR